MYANLFSKRLTSAFAIDLGVVFKIAQCDDNTDSPNYIALSIFYYTSILSLSLSVSHTIETPSFAVHKWNITQSTNMKQWVNCFVSSHQLFPFSEFLIGTEFSLNTRYVCCCLATVRFGFLFFSITFSSATLWPKYFDGISIRVRDYSFYWLLYTRLMLSMRATEVWTMDMTQISN